MTLAVLTRLAITANSPGAIAGHFGPALTASVQEHFDELPIEAACDAHREKKRRAEIQRRHEERVCLGRATVARSRLEQ